VYSLKQQLILYVLIMGLLSGCQTVGGRTLDISDIEQEASQIVADDVPVLAQAADLIQHENRLSPTGGYTVRELCCERDGLTIKGVAYIPDGIEKAPTVIISHGFNGSYASNIEYAETLAEIGIASYTFDFCGRSTDSTSDGSMLEMSVLTEVADLIAVIDTIKTLDFVDTDNIFLLGRSQGGFVSALTAAQRADDIQGMVLFYPAFVIQTMVRDTYRNTGKLPEQASIMGATIGKRYYEDALKVDAYSDIQGYTRDVLIIHGDKDSVVPLSYSEDAARAYASAELIVLEGAGHGFYGEDASQAINAVIGYTKQHLHAE